MCPSFHLTTFHAGDARERACPEFRRADAAHEPRLAITSPLHLICPRRRRILHRCEPTHPWMHRNRRNGQNGQSLEHHRGDRRRQATSQLGHQPRFGRRMFFVLFLSRYEAEFAFFAFRAKFFRPRSLQTTLLPLRRLVRKPGCRSGISGPTLAHARRSARNSRKQDAF